MNELKHIVILLGAGVFSSVLFSQDCDEGMVFMEHFGVYSNVCVPTTFSTVDQSMNQAFYFFESATINGDTVDKDDWVGAFNGDVCVGATRKEATSDDVYLAVMGDDSLPNTEGYMNQGDFPTYKIYDNSTNIYYDAITSPNYPFYWNNINSMNNLNVFPDCFGDLGGDAIEDCAGVCDGIAVEDCGGECDGDAVIDNCDVCDNDTSNDCEQDCAGVWGGIAEEEIFYVDWDGDGLGAGSEYLLCNGFDLDGFVSNNDDEDDNCYSNSHDCAGVCDGIAVEDCAGVCDGIAVEDCTGVCDGIAVEDCTGVCDGDAVVDECGECDGNGADVMCSDGSYICDESDCPELGGDPFTFNQSTQFAYYFVFSAYDCPGDYLVAGEDWIGVYNGDVCVGGKEWPGGPVEVPAYGDDGEAYSAGYLNSGDMPTYKIYDASENMYYDAMPNENFAFQPFGVNNILRMDAGLFQNVMLDEGANLVSFYVLPDDNSMEDMMEPLSGNISAVLSDGAAAQYLDGWGWIGSLTSFEYESGYWLIMSAADELNLEGCDSPQDLVYDLEEGANLISYPDPASTDVSEAIPDDVENLFEAILSQGNAAMNTGNGWVGSLTSFDGGAGYWVIVSESFSFSYNLNDGIGRTVEVYSESMPTFGDYKVTQSSEQAFYFVDEITLLEGNVEAGDWLLSYNDNVLTGIRQWQGTMIDVPVMGSSDDLRTAAYFVEGDVPTFKLLKKSNDELISLGGEVDKWASNGVFTLSGLFEIESAPEKISLDSAYPNPFNPTTTIGFGLPFDSEVSIQVYNLQGRVVETLASGHMQAGYHSVTWNTDNFSSGVYFAKMIAGEYINTQKLILVK